MTKKKKREEQKPSRRDRIQEALNSHLSVIYLSFVGGILTVIFILFGIGIVLRNPIAVEDYSLGTIRSTLDYHVVISSKYKTSDDQTLVFPIEISQDNLLIQKVPKLNVTTQFIGATNQQVKTNLIQGDHSYYEFQIQYLPETWKAVRLEISFDDGESILLFDFSRDPKKEAYTILKSNYVFSKESAEVRSVEVEIRKAEHQFQTIIPEKMKKIEEEKSDLEAQKIEIEENSKYLTETEKNKAKSTIFTIETQQNALQGNLYSYQKLLAETEEKILLLNQKKEEVMQKNGLVKEQISLSE